MDVWFWGLVAALVLVPPALGLASLWTLRGYSRARELLAQRVDPARWSAWLREVGERRRGAAGALAFGGRLLLAAGPVLLAGGAAAVLAVAAFAEIAGEVMGEEEWVRFDERAGRALRDGGSAAADAFFAAVTWLGDGLVITAIGVGVALVLLVQRRWLLLLGWVVVLAGGGLLNHLLKVLFRRDRPAFPDVVAPLSYSFPSGHSMNALVCYGTLAILALLTVRGARVRALIVAVCCELVLLVGASRAYLGVHYVSDVLGGYAAGLAWLFGAALALAIVRRRVTPRRAAVRRAEGH